MLRSPPGSPKMLARTAGVLYLALIGTALFSEFFVRSRLIAHGDQAATARNILNSEPIYRLGVISDLVNLVCDTIVAVLLYYIFRNVDRLAAALATAFRIIMICVLGTAGILSLASLRLVEASAHATPAAVGQFQQLALIMQDLRGQATNVALIFFGAHLVLIGLLTVRSTFLPRALGILLGLAGLGYLLNSLIRFAAPGLIDPYFPYLAALWGLAEWSFALWLLIVGVNAENWTKSTL